MLAQIGHVQAVCLFRLDCVCSDSMYVQSRLRMFRQLVCPTQTAYVQTVCMFNPDCVFSGRVAVQPRLWMCRLFVYTRFVYVQALCVFNSDWVHFLQEEKLEGENQYMCSVCNSKQNAVRSIQLQTLPPVLNLQLLRFVFDVWVC